MHCSGYFRFETFELAVPPPVCLIRPVEQVFVRNQSFVAYKGIVTTKKLSYKTTFYTFIPAKMEEPIKRRIEFFEDHAIRFISSLPRDVQSKISWVLRIIQRHRMIKTKFFKHLRGTDGLYEIRIQIGTNHYRLICFFNDQNTLVILNGFQKKTQKTPKDEFKKAIRLKKLYEEQHDISR